jgi:hypothetical protein
MRIFRMGIAREFTIFSSRCLFFIVPVALPRNSVDLLSDDHLDYGMRELEWGVSGRRPNSMSKRMRKAPMAMAESATLKAG